MINGEIIVDNFAGGGGASTGIEIATGISVDIAINHDPEAIRMHKANHPSTKHYCEDVWQVDPLEACKGRPVALAWFSPDCKHFSKAKGSKPVEKNIRGLAWVALRWAGLVRPRVIMLENVEEFRTWGPLRPVRDPDTGRVLVRDLEPRTNINQQKRMRTRVANRGEVVPVNLQIMEPDPNKKGQTFRKFIKQLESLGYTVEYRELIAADYGAPTMRKRFFLIARCDGKPIAWPEPTHGPADSEKVKTGLLKPYLGAYTQLDFSLPCPSIFDSAEEIKKKYGIRAVRPLAPKTMERIARGLKKFVLDNSEPFIVQANHSGAKSDYCKDTNEPLNTTRKYGLGIVDPYIVQIGQTGFAADRSKDVREPLTTIVSKNEHCLIEPKLAPIIDKTYGGNYQGCGSRLDKPLDTITTVDHNRLVTAKLAPYIEVNRSDRPGNSVEDPLNTITGVNQHCLIEPKLAPFMGVNTTNHPGGYCKNPLHTITTGGQQCLISPTLIQSIPNKPKKQKTIDIPLIPADHTATTSAGHFGEVRAFLIKYYGQGTGQDIKKPLDTITAQDRFGLVTIEGVDYQIVDIGLRMLEPKELYGCQGFPEDYIIDRDYTGKVYSRTEQVRRCGNAVCPPIPAALVKANLPELCVATRIGNLKIETETSGQLKFA